MPLSDESPLLPHRPEESGYQTRAAGGGAGFLLYGALDSPLQSIDIERCAACINDAVHFRSRNAPCPEKYLQQNYFRNSFAWGAVYVIAILLFMCRCVRNELNDAISDIVLFLIDFAAIFVIATDLVLKKLILGMRSVALDLFMLALCLTDSAYIFHTREFSFFTVIRIYFIVTFSEETMNACRNSVLCLGKVFTAISVQALSCVFFSCMCVVLFGLEDSLFHDLPHAVVNMFALITTSNNPDVWVKLYALDRANVILFLCYLFVSVFFLQNYVAVTIFSEFSQLTNDSLYLRQQHRQRSLRMAFEILDFRHRNSVDPSVVYAVLQHMRPHYSKEKIEVLYDFIDPNHDFRTINFEKFCRIIDALGIRVSKVYPPSRPGWVRSMCTPTSSLYKTIFYLVPVMNSVFMTYICMAGKREMVGELAWFTVSGVVGLTALSLSFLFIDMCTFGVKESFKHVWIYLTFVEAFLSLSGVLWMSWVFFKNPPATSLLTTEKKKILEYVIKSGSICPLVIALCGRCVAMLHIIRALPHFRKIVYSSYAVMPGLVPMIVPLFSVAHVFAFIGMYCFAGLLNSEVDFGDGRGQDPYYGLLDFSSYTNSLIIIVNLLVVNNWVKMGSGLSNATGSLWVYAYFMAFFVIGVTFCLLSLTSIFISSIMIDQENNPLTKRAATSGGPSPPFVTASPELVTQQASRVGPAGMADYKLSLRHQDSDQLFRIIDSVSAPDFRVIMELMGSMIGGCTIVLSGSNKVLFESPSALMLLDSYTDGGMTALYNDMVNDIAAPARLAESNKRRETRVSEVYERDNTSREEKKVIYLLSGPIALGVLKYTEPVQDCVMPSTEAEKVSRLLQVRYCSNRTPEVRKIRGMSDADIAVFVMKESSQATI